jgi:hypothetical protein
MEGGDEMEVVAEEGKRDRESGGRVLRGAVKRSK